MSRARTEARLADAVERGRDVVARALRVLPQDQGAALAQSLDLLADDAVAQLRRDAQWLGERARQ